MLRFKITFWLVFILCIEAVLLIFHLSKSSGKTTTTVELVQPGEVIFPDLKFCYSHWLQWFNFTAAKERGFTMPEIFMALSFLTNIYSSTYFTKEETVPIFTRKLKEANLFSLDDFFKEFIFGIGETHLVSMSIKYSALLHMDLMCFEIPQESIRPVVDKNFEIPWPRGHQWSLMHSSFDPDLLVARLSYVMNIPKESISLFSEAEYEANFKAVLSALDIQSSAKFISLPIILYPNAYEKNYILVKENQTCWVDIKATVHSFKDSPTKPCITGLNYRKARTKCMNACLKADRKSQFKNEPWEWAAGFIYSRKITFLNSTMKPIKFFSPDYTLVVISDSDCYHNCSYKYGCEIWSYNYGTPWCSNRNKEETRSNDEKVHSKVVFNYPGSIDQQIIRVKEVDSDTLEAFIGNIGGLLGIWTGASILTLIQTIYLCVCRSSRKHRSPVNLKNQKTSTMSIFPVTK